MTNERIKELENSYSPCWIELRKKNELIRELVEALEYIFKHTNETLERDTAEKALCRAKEGLQ